MAGATGLAGPLIERTVKSDEMDGTDIQVGRRRRKKAYHVLMRIDEDADAALFAFLENLDYVFDIFIIIYSTGG